MMPTLVPHACGGCAVVLALSMLFAQPTPKPYVAVIQKVSGTVGLYTEEGRSLAQIKVGNFPHEAVLSRDGRFLYVSDNGVLWMTEDAPGSNTISVIDTAVMKKVGSIDLGRFHRPHGIAFAGDHLLATTERPFGLIMADTSKRTLVRDFDVKGKSPHMVIPAPDGKRVFVSNTDSDTVAVIDISTGETTLISTPARPQGGVFSPDGRRLYVATTNGNQIAIIDPVTLQVTGTIPTGKGPGRIAITPDGKTLIYNLQFEPAIGFADVASGKQIASVPLTGRPLSLTLNREGTRAFTGIQEQDQVVFISVRQRAIERVLNLPKGSGPDPVIQLDQSQKIQRSSK